MNREQRTRNTEKKAHGLRRGFTLVEMIVSLAIFSIVATVALGALVKIVSANKKAQTLQASITNLNFALDSLSRELRVGRNYYCISGTSFTLRRLPANSAPGAQKCGTSPISNGSGAVIAFNSPAVDDSNPNDPCNLIYAYRFVPSGDGYELQKAQQEDCTGGGTFDGDFQSIIDPNVTITGYFLKVTNATFPAALVRISGFAGAREKEKTYFDVQTNVSSRVK